MLQEQLSPAADPQLPAKSSWRRLFARLHNDERGEVSIETVLILAAIALPILIFVIKFGWPRIKTYFEKGMTDLENNGQNAANNNAGN